MTTKITEQNISNISNAAVQWQTVVTADGSTATSAVAGYGYFIDTTSAAHTVNLPNTASVGDTIILKDYAGTWGTNNVTISSTLKISGADADGTLSTNNTTVTIVYMDTTKGWTPIQNSTQSALAQDATFISATGGTITTSGDYKIHTFTGDGCFVVSSLGGGGTPCAHASTVDYLVVAGGGAGTGDRGGGGGGGGYRMSASLEAIPGSPGAPLANPTGITISATTYPITVGAGGSAPLGQPVRGTQGSNSVFSTITSAGGGEGGGGPGINGGNGGSGGGSRDSTGATGGSGNTPPTSPPQGQSGQPYNLPVGSGAGYGGGGAIGGGSGVNGGVGAGIPSTFGTTGENSGGTYYYSAGGGGGADSPGGTVGNGGLGGGGDGGPPAGGIPASLGTPNTGGGGGGGGNGPGTALAGSGGKGLVVIKYKYQ